MHENPFKSDLNPHLNRPDQRGFTLIELMISVLLASILIIAAFHIQTTFQSTLNRQEEVTRMQQTMKVTRSLLTRHIRGAGGGISANVWSACGGEHAIGPFMLHNSNDLGSTDLAEGDTDTDPDWFEVMGADQNASGVLSQNQSILDTNKSIYTPTKFQPGDLGLIQNEHGACLLMISAVQANFVTHDTSGHGGAKLAGCYNGNLGMCQRELQTNQLPQGSRLLNLSSKSAAFRVDTTNPTRPLLMMAPGVAGGDPTQYEWQPIAEGVEDMQLAAHVDTDDPPDAMGDIWVNSRDLRSNELHKVRAVRLSLVFRSTHRIPRWNAGLRPALEDRPESSPADGYIRRVVQTIVKVRNIPLETGP
jgi:prepilin-type N-terminal cleavage/methylation domain-containing protein